MRDVYEPGTRVQALECISGKYRRVERGEYGKTIGPQATGVVTVDFDGDFYDVRVDQVTADVEPICGWCKRPGSRCACDPGDFE